MRCDRARAQDHVDELERDGLARLTDDDQRAVFAKDVGAELVAGNGVGRNDGRVDTRHVVAELALDLLDRVGGWLRRVDHEIGRKLETACQLQCVLLDVDANDAKAEDLCNRDAEVTQCTEAAIS